MSPNDMSVLFVLLWAGVGAAVAVVASAAMVALAESRPLRVVLASEWRQRCSVSAGFLPVLGPAWRLLTQPMSRVESVRSLLCDILLTGAFAYLAWRWGPSWPLMVLSLYIVVLTIVSGVDLICRLIPNRVIAPAAVFALVVAPTMSQVGLLSAVVGGLIGFVLFLIPALIVRGGMGAGDVKLAGFVGLAVGFLAVLTALLTGVIIGGAAILLLLITHRVGRRSHIPYGPFLAVGAALVLLAW
jgi:Flp pilus assembly protein protease CpaA